MRLKVSSAKRRPFCLGLNVLMGPRDRIYQQQREVKGSVFCSCQIAEILYQIPAYYSTFHAQFLIVSVYSLYVIFYDKWAISVFPFVLPVPVPIPIGEIYVPMSTTRYTGPVFYLCLRTCLETVLAKTVLRHVLDHWRCRFSVSVLDRRSFFKFKFKFLLSHYHP